jgi:uncharacterized membrane protein
VNIVLARRWRWLALASIAVLIALVVGWQLSPTASGTGAAKGLFLCIPLLLPLLGLWRGNRYTFRWATLCVLPYFIVGLTEVVANPTTRAWTATMLVFALTWFVGLVAYLRVTAASAT